MMKENPYGEISTAPTPDVSVSAVVSRSKTDGSRLHHPCRLSCPSLNLHERSLHRLSAPLPQSSVTTKRALPELPELSARLENKNRGALYSTIDHSMPVLGRDGSFLYSEGPTNPTYESIDVDFYSKLGNGGPSLKRYDYPIFAPENRPTIATDDVLYQSASQIYAGVSEDPYSSITSHTGGEANYDVEYSHVQESMNTEPPRYLANAQAESRTLDHLYSRIRRGPSMHRATNSSTYRFLPSNEFAVEYNSSGSDKTSREPSYRYITVRESVDVIRQRLNEFNSSSNTAQSVITSGYGLIREHYYSSIGGSDYETLQISATSASHPSCDDQQVLSTSCASHDVEPETISSAVSVCENIPPKPPTSPIPLRITVIEDNLQKKQRSLSSTNMNEAVNDDDSCNNISEKIRKLRTNFFDQELKLLEDLKGSSSTNLRFRELLGTINQCGTSKWVNSSGINRNLESKQYGVQTSSTNFDDIYPHLPKSTADRPNVHNAQNVTQNAPPFTANRQKVIDEEHCEITTQNSRSRDFHKANILGTKQSIEEESNDEEQYSIPMRRHILGNQTENNSRNTCFPKASLNESSNDTKKDMEAQPLSCQRNMMELCEESGTEGDRSVQTASLNFSHESVDENVRNDEDSSDVVKTAKTDPSWSLISSGENILSYVNRADNKSPEAPGINQYNFLKN
uniref:Tensin n=1 Tax=Loa loa TaxID=7209 RepID=A0A1I7VN91_LOALO